MDSATSAPDLLSPLRDRLRLDADDFHWGSKLPGIGASGAISGVLGAYIVFFPRAQVLTFIFIITVRLPAMIFIGYWFVLQFLSATSSLQGGPSNGGVAWWAHVGGFLLGILLASTIMRPKQRWAT